MTLKRMLLLFTAVAVAMAQESGTATDRPNTNEPAFGGDYTPITIGERFDWTVNSTIGPKNLAAGLVTSGWGTWHNNPPEYGPHWDGYAKRYGLRLTSSATSNVLEASLGGLWGEDPRYFRAAGQSAGRRFTHVVGGVFITRNRNGNLMPAYARYLAIPSATFLSNTWRPYSQATAADAGVRIGLSFLSRLVGNAFSEFFPDLRRRGSRRAVSRPTGDADSK